MLSRHPVGTCLTTSVGQPQWLTAVQDSYGSDPHAQSIMAKLLLDASVVPNFSLRDGLLRYKSRIWIGNDASVKHKLLTELHSNAIGGHSGIPVTFRRMKQLFA